jgi:hypothetical protein
MARLAASVALGAALMLTGAAAARADDFAATARNIIPSGQSAASPRLRAPTRRPGCTTR